MTTASNSMTVLSEFSRAIRDEPLFYIFKHKVWLHHDTVSAHEVVSWLKKRYVETSVGHRFKVRSYLHQNGNRYVDYILFETLGDDDIAYLRLRWGWSKEKIKRSARIKGRKRLTKEQRAALDARIAAVMNEFYSAL